MLIVPSSADLSGAAAAPGDIRTVGAQPAEPAEGRAFVSQAPGLVTSRNLGTDTQPLDIAALLAAS
jgi:hypothetical protein